MTDRTDGDRSESSSDVASDPDSIESSAGPDETIGTADDGLDAVDRRSVTTDGDDGPTGILGWLRWFRTTDTVSVIYLRDILTSILIVLAIGVLLFAASGVWPPMVAVESGSMEPNMERGDLIFLVDNGRFPPDQAVVYDGVSTGVVPADVAEGHGRTEFGGYGDVIVFRPNGNTGDVPIIHRAMFFVEEGENWYDRADPAAVGGADDCAELSHCPAPNAGFITKGDNERTNANYDQTSRLSAPVHPDWIIGSAKVRVPYLGHVRLILSGVMVTPIEVVEFASPPAGPTEPTPYSPAEEPIEPARANSQPA